MLFIFNDTATTEIYTLSLHDALPIYARRGGLLRALDLRRSRERRVPARSRSVQAPGSRGAARPAPQAVARSEEHTSELQSRQYLVCRLLLEKKKIRILTHMSIVCVHN